MAEETQSSQEVLDGLGPEVQTGTSSAPAKVQLDLDDAPFMRPPEEKAVAKKPEPAQSAEPEVDPAAEAKKKRRKLILMAGVAVVALVILAIAAWLLFPEAPPPAEEIKPEIIVVPAKPPVVKKPDYVKEFAPFFVPRPDESGKVRFLVCKFSSLSKDAGLEAELDRKMIALRDALYFYLHSKSSEYILDNRNAATIKQDLTAVLNDYLTQGRIEDILFETYLND